VDARLTATGDDLAPDEREWLLRSEARWRRAHAIACRHPGIDVGDAYHVLRALELSPSERLRRGLTRVRAGTHTR